MNAKKAVELGFADKLLFSKEETEAEEEKELEMEAVMFSRKAVTNSLMSKLISKPEKKTCLMYVLRDGTLRLSAMINRKVI